MIPLENGLIQIRIHNFKLNRVILLDAHDIVLQFIDKFGYSMRFYVPLKNKYNDFCNRLKDKLSDYDIVFLYKENCFFIKIDTKLSYVNGLLKIIHKKEKYNNIYYDEFYSEFHYKSNHKIYGYTSHELHSLCIVKDNTLKSVLIPKYINDTEYYIIPDFTIY